MCTLCAALRPFDPLAPQDQYLTGVQRAPGLFAGGFSTNPAFAPFMLDQIANQLTDATSNGWRHAFVLDDTRTLTVNLDGLELDAVRAITRMSLDAWTDVTSIRFVEVAIPDPTSLRVEAGMSQVVRPPRPP